MIRVGLVGYGYWGPNLARNLVDSGFELARIADRNPTRIELAQYRHPNARTTRDETDVLRADDIDAVVIATPASTHYDMVLDALLGGKHVLVTKPLANTKSRAKQLVDIAEDASLKLMVDHTFVFSEAVRQVTGLVNCDIGMPLFYDSTRVNLGVFQQDVDVIWDLAVHDFSILAHVLNQKPHRMWATGADLIGTGKANIAWITIEYKLGFMAHITVSWLSPVKVRRALLAGDEAMIVYDDIEPSEKVKLYRQGLVLETKAEAHRELVSYRRGDMYCPELDPIEALRNECDHFKACIESGWIDSPTGGQHAVDVVAMLEAASASLANGGVAVHM